MGAATSIPTGHALVAQTLNLDHGLDFVGRTNKTGAACSCDVRPLRQKVFHRGATDRVAATIGSRALEAARGLLEFAWAWEGPEPDVAREPSLGLPHPTPPSEGSLR
jgi:hypothetical protein